MVKRKGEIGMSTMVYIAIGLLVLILMALLIGKSYTNSQQANNNCGLVDKSNCSPTKCTKGQGIGICPEKNSKKQYCCKT